MLRSLHLCNCRSSDNRLFPALTCLVSFTGQNLELLMTEKLADMWDLRFFTATSMKMVTFWVVAPYHLTLTDVSHEFTASIMLLWKVGKFLPGYSVLHPRRRPSSLYLIWFMKPFDIELRLLNKSDYFSLESYNHGNWQKRVYMGVANTTSKFLTSPCLLLLIHKVMTESSPTWLRSWLGFPTRGFPKQPK